MSENKSLFFKDAFNNLAATLNWKHALSIKIAFNNNLVLSLFLPVLSALSLCPSTPLSSHQDEKYWQRRKKNNVAAKRSRDARRLKENQITVRAAFLERENTALRQEVGELRKDFARSKNVVARYAAKFGEL